MSKREGRVGLVRASLQEHGLERGLARVKEGRLVVGSQDDVFGLCRAVAVCRHLSTARRGAPPQTSFSASSTPHVSV